jgi:hypothetical protein
VCSHVHSLDKLVKWTHEDGAKQGSPILGYGGVLEMSS